MKTNTSINRVIETTYEGTPAKCINAEQQLRRSVLACMLWESSFYEDGVDIAKRIADCVKNVDPQKVSELAIETRTKMKLRHAPLWIVREMARLPKHKAFVSYTLQNVIQRADELSEFVSLYWSEKRQPLSAQVKKGLAEAFRKFDGYALAKYNSRDANVKLRDVLFLCHANPKNKEQENLWKQLIDNKLPIPNTWENRLSSGEDKKTVWESMLKENELGALALLRNLRNMAQVGVDENIVFYALSRMKVDSVLPFRFISAAKAVPQWESEIEKVMLKCLDGKEKLGGKTVILIDVSYSMHSPISEKSDLMRYDVANGLAILARELCDKVAIYTFSDNIVRIPDRHGFALRDAIVSSQPHVGTYLGHAIDFISKEYNYDRIIVITDEQSCDTVSNPIGKGYMINVASYKNGIGYGAWTHFDGFSEAILDYIIESEKLTNLQ